MDLRPLDDSRARLSALWFLLR